MADLCWAAGAGSVDVQIRDLDLAGGNVTIRHGKGGRMRRVVLHPETIQLLGHYLNKLRCPQGIPAIGSDAERESLMVGFASTRPRRPMHPGANQRLVQRRVVERRARGCCAFPYTKRR